MSPASKFTGRKLRAKFDEQIAARNFYEAHQICNTLLFRFSNSRNFDEALDLIVYSANTFLDHQVFHSSFDLVNSFVNLLERSSKFDEKERLNQFKLLLARLKHDPETRLTVVNSAIKKSKSSQETRGSPSLHLHLAKLYEEEFDLQRARYHYLFSNDSKACALFCIKLSHAGLTSELALFPTQAVLQFLVIDQLKYAEIFLETYIQYHPKVVNKNPPFDLPLLNFCFLLLIAIPSGNIDSYLQLTSTYEKSLKRDTSFAPCLEKIGVKYFGLKLPGRSASGGGLMDILDSLFDVMGEGAETDTNKGQRDDEQDEGDVDGISRDSKRIKISELKMEASDLD